MTGERGRPIALEDGSTTLTTVHPAHLLRLPDAATKAVEWQRLVTDLAKVRTLL